MCSYICVFRDFKKGISTIITEYINKGLKRNVKLAVKIATTALNHSADSSSFFGSFKTLLHQFAHFRSLTLVIKAQQKHTHHHVSIFNIANVDLQTYYTIDERIVCT